MDWPVGTLTREGCAPPTGSHSPVEATLRLQLGCLRPNLSSTTSRLWEPGQALPPLCFPFHTCAVELTVARLYICRPCQGRGSAGDGALVLCRCPSNMVLAVCNKDSAPSSPAPYPSQSWCSKVRQLSGAKQVLFPGNVDLGCCFAEAAQRQAGGEEGRHWRAGEESRLLLPVPILREAVRLPSLRFRAVPL